MGEGGQADVATAGWRQDTCKAAKDVLQLGEADRGAVRAGNNQCIHIHKNGHNNHTGDTTAR